MRANRVHTWLRVRPSQSFTPQHIEILPDGRTINLHLPRSEKKKIVNNQVLDWSFKVDGVFHNATQEVVYKTVGSDMITAGLNGYNGTIMCYGQTGAGKTFTMTGATETFQNRGIVPRSLSELYKRIEAMSDESSVTVRVSYLEIYNEQINDLLATMPERLDAVAPQLQVVEDEYSVYVKGLGRHLAQTEEDALNLLFEGETNRATAAHILNKNSSRSHTIFTVYLETRSRIKSDAMYTEAKINFVDLAGSERVRKTQSTGKTLQEASYINKSLSFLEQTVIALGERNRDHIPFRQSKLTHYLKDSIGGTCKTVLIANVWGEATHIDETVSTLRFATRMMRVSSEPIENKQYDSLALVKSLQNEIAALRRELAMHDTLNNRNQVAYDQLSEQQKYEIRQQVRKYVEGSLDELDVVNLRQIQGVYEAFREICQAYKKEADVFQQKLATEKTSYSELASGPTQSRSHGGGGAGSSSQDKQATSAEDSSTHMGLAVGEVDPRSGFGLGNAPKSALDETGAFLMGKKKDKRRGTLSSVKVGGKPGVEPTLSPDLTQQASGSLSRTEAFEDFKREEGSKIYETLSSNKDFLSKKKQEYTQLAKQINDTKMKIDRTRMELESLRAEREAQGPSYTEDGEVIITEEEFRAINNLRDLKTLYKSDYEELKKIKSHVCQCQKMVELTRQKLIQEFDLWYCDNFLEPEKHKSSFEAGYGTRLGTIPSVSHYPAADNGTGLYRPAPDRRGGDYLLHYDESRYEDPLEKFDRVKHDHFGKIEDAEAYNRAKEAVLHRQVYMSAKMQPQPAQRKPGAPIVTPKTQMPTAFDVHS